MAAAGARLSLALTSLYLFHATTAAASPPSATLLRNHLLKLNPRAGSRLLAGDTKTGDLCRSATGDDPCPAGTPGREGREGMQRRLSCCNSHCRDVLSDGNNCGGCGLACPFGQLCCAGRCAAVAHDVNNCGECGAVCSHGVRCEYGTCGYA